MHLYLAIKRLKESRAFAQSLDQEAMLNFVEPTDLTTLGSVLDEYCSRHLIVELNDRDECARRILALFSSGITSREDLLQRMNRLALLNNR